MDKGRKRKRWGNKIDKEKEWKAAGGGGGGGGEGEGGGVVVVVVVVDCQMLIRGSCWEKERVFFFSH